ncbi:Vitamin K epoxide reductase complex subunit 1-like protein 1 [Habropoda laboriosa]|uniref:vitamin-K-epoxide reductase (warfarin-sensitive) n=1 Tax=Habropoda laboriosa TaxID=597456 RepID=A0A0L7R5L9_9HYME|nr:PREDICTED: vitamin K epoxide reductase complex subunit 1-like protein 1 [Habropoda laboriosa]XP_017789238.1 PREDICTED: vitamin K epoxide reductase complex subunit 1-like protein 1 [Habropoda laboriosa]KOC66114.1 Vitamin K epoxide reductase complex subunit 1-like protein 1 [Habropoda laboriosa]
MPSTKGSVQKLNTAIVIRCILGLAVSCYAYYVELATEEDDSYEAMCDISEHISCTKAFSSEYGKGFGIIPETSILYAPNPVYGLIFYALIALLSMSNRYITSAMVVTLGILANFGTIYLAYILYILNNICVVCVSTYIINAAILILSVKKHRQLFWNAMKNRQKKSN